MHKVSPAGTESTPVEANSGMAVVGFSARSLAEATAQLGFRAVVVDHFADLPALAARLTAPSHPGSPSPSLSTDR